MDAATTRPTRPIPRIRELLRPRNLLPAPLTSPAATYVMRTLLAMALALYLSFLLQLDSPGSALITVIIVANPTRGAIISKGIWRIFGTFTGAVASVVIIACFAQSSLLFLVAFAAWLGACVFVSGMFRLFHAYAAVLSGYTVAIIAFGALSNPDNILLLALSRLAVVTIGVVSSTIVTMVFQPGITREAVFSRGMAALRGVAHLIQAHAGGMDDTAFQAQRTRLAGEIEGLDETVEFAGVEAVDVHTHAPSLRRGFASLYAALVMISAADAPLDNASARATADAGRSPETRALVAEASAALARIAAIDTHDPGVLLRHSEALSALIQEIVAAQNEAQTTIDVAVLARVRQIVRQLHDCLAVLAAWRAGHAPFHGSAPLKSFKDFDLALRNMLRAVIATILAGLFWYATAWTYGSIFLLFVGVICALISSAPSAAAASVQFAKGAMISTLVAPLCGFGILPHVSGFPLVFLSMLPFLAIGIYGTTKPKYALMSLAFVIFFLTELSIANVMRYDFQAFLNIGLATVAGAGTGALIFRILIPPNPARDARRLVRGIRQAIQRLVDRNIRSWYPRDPLGWQVFVNQRLQRLLMRLMFRPATRSRAIGAAGALLIVARQILALREEVPLVTLPPDLAAQADSALRSLGNLRDCPAAEAATLRACHALSTFGDAAKEHRIDVLRIAARFRAISAQLPEAAQLLALETTCSLRG